MAEHPMVEKFLAMRERNIAKLPKFSAELEAMGREVVKDIRGTLHQAFFNQPEHPGEPGTPLNPTPQLVTEGLTGKDIYGRGNEVSPGKDQRSLEMDMG